MIVFLVYNHLIFILRNGATLGLFCDNGLRCFDVGQNLRLFAKS